MFSGACLREREMSVGHCLLLLFFKKVTLIVQSHIVSDVVDSLNNL